MSIKQLLTFSLADELFGINVIQVREVLSLQKITPIPGSPEYMEGIINVRGSIVSILDLRKKFSMEAKESTIDTSIVVLEINGDDETLTVGIIVDSVLEVSTFSEEQIDDAPSIGMSVQQAFIEGIGKKDDSFIIILNSDAIFYSDELMDMKQPLLA